MPHGPVRANDSPAPTVNKVRARAYYGGGTLYATPQRAEPLLRSAIRIMIYMRSHGLGVVSVPRKELDARPGITPNYVLRSLATMPRFEGTTNIPTIDNFLVDRFHPAAFRFATAVGARVLTIP